MVESTYQQRMAISMVSRHSVDFSCTTY